MKKSNTGFFLIELMVVCAICALCACLSLVCVHEFNHFLLRTHLDYLHSTCLCMQKTAMLHGQEFKIMCDEHNHALYIEGREQKFPTHIKFGFLPTGCGSPGSMQESLTKAITFKNNTIHFYPDGTISSGTLYITDARQKAMYALTSPVGSISYLKKYKYENARWKLLL